MGRPSSLFVVPMLFCTLCFIAAAFPAAASADGPAYLGDCVGGQSSPACGWPPARWDLSAGPIPFCTFQTARPASLGADQFRSAVQVAIAVWNAAGAAITLRYTGDCLAGTSPRLQDGVNEIGFDANGTAVTGAEAAQTLSEILWAPPASPTIREIVEADITIAPAAGGFPPACFANVLVHEFGHAIGLGHSTNRADVMYPVVDPFAPGACKTAPSASEYATLQKLYGVAPPGEAAGGTQGFAARTVGAATGVIPAAGGFGLIVFGGGTGAQLLHASGCPLSSAAFWASDGAGGFAAFIPGSTVAAVNAGWYTRFPGSVLPGTALIGRCR